MSQVSPRQSHMLVGKLTLTEISVRPKILKSVVGPDLQFPRRPFSQVDFVLQPYMAQGVCLEYVSWQKAVIFCPWPHLISAPDSFPGTAGWFPAPFCYHPHAVLGTWQGSPNMC